MAPCSLAAAVALVATAVGVELHPGNLAVHSTILTRLQPSRTQVRTIAAKKDRGRRTAEISGRGEISVSQEVEAADGVRETPDITTELQDMKSEYLGQVGIGTSAEGGALFQARVVFDTGSTNLWVASSLCEGAACSSASKHREEFYDPGKSQTSRRNVTGQSSEIDITFGTGELKGPMIVDTFRLGSLKVVDQPFAMIREMRGMVFTSIPFEGIVGLAFPSLSFGGIKPFFDRVIEQKVLTSNEFAFFLNEDWRKPSAIFWGGVDPDMYEGEIKMFPVVQHHYWALELVDFRVGNTSYKDIEGHPTITKLVVDSGTTYYSGPPWFLDKVLPLIPATACSDTEDYPDLNFVLRDSHGKEHTISIPEVGYMLEGQRNRCSPGWMSIEVKGEYGPALILGEVFVRRYFTVFKRGDGSPDQARVGFARARSGALPKVATHGQDTPMEEASEPEEDSATEADRIDGQNGAVQEEAPDDRSETPPTSSDDKEREDDSSRRRRAVRIFMRDPGFSGPQVPLGEADDAVVIPPEAKALQHVKDPVAGMPEALVRREQKGPET